MFLFLGAVACGGSENDSGTIHGLLSESDESKNGVYYDLISIGSVAQGQTIVVDAIPHGFDLILVLLNSAQVDEAGYYTAEDNGTIDEEESLVYTMPESHHIWIAVTTYSEGETGDYTLSYKIKNANDDQSESEILDEDATTEVVSVHEESCHGSATSCRSISGYSGNCSNQDGCYMGSTSDGYGGHKPVCEGYADSCSNQYDEYDCEHQMGCSWY